jgi:hypothetical protein
MSGALGSDYSVNAVRAMVVPGMCPTRPAFPSVGWECGTFDGLEGAVEEESEAWKNLIDRESGP